MSEKGMKLKRELEENCDCLESFKTLKNIDF